MYFVYEYIELHEITFRTTQYIFYKKISCVSCKGIYTRHSYLKTIVNTFFSVIFYE